MSEWVVDRYQLRSVIHDGEHATVYLAFHTLLGSQHALKMEKVGVSREIHDAMLQEARIQGMLRHPHVLGAADGFLHEGRLVVVMDYVKGRSLADYLEDGPYPSAHVLGLFRGVLRGLRAAHQARIVHRDLKPENILLAPSGSGFMPLLTDFGLAKVLEPSARIREGISQEYSVIGTPEYMAPEQARDPSSVTEAADQFSAGALLYELLTGLVCFEAPSRVESQRRIAVGEYVPLLALAPHVPPRLEHIIGRMLHPDPTERYRSVGSVLRRLDGMVIG